MSTITAPEPSVVSFTGPDAAVSPPQAPKTLPLTNAANAPQASTSSANAASNGITGDDQHWLRTARAYIINPYTGAAMTKGDGTASLSFTLDEAFPRRDSAQRHTQRLNTSETDVAIFPEEIVATPRAKLRVSFVRASRKLLMHQICENLHKARETPHFEEYPRNAPRFLKTAEREIQGILSALDNNNALKKNNKICHYADHKASESALERLYSSGKLSVAQRIMLGAFDEVKANFSAIAEGFPYCTRDIGSSRRLLLQRVESLIMEMADRRARAEKLLTDNYMQNTLYTISKDMVNTLLEPARVAFIVERTAGLTMEQQRALVQEEIQLVFTNLKHQPLKFPHLAAVLAEANNAPSHSAMPAVAPPTPPRCPPTETVAARVSEPISVEISTRTPTPEPSEPSHRNAVTQTDAPKKSYLSRILARLRHSSAAAASEPEQAAAARATPPETLSETTAEPTAEPTAETTAETTATTSESETDRSDRPGRFGIFGIFGIFGNLMHRFRSLFSFARTRSAPDLDAPGTVTLEQAQRMCAAADAYDKIIDQGVDISRILQRRNGTPTETDNVCSDANSNGSAGQEITGAARDDMLRNGKVTFDLGRQLSLDTLLSASDSDALRSAGEYDIDGIHFLEEGRIFRTDQRAFLNGMDAITHALAQLPPALRRPGSDLGKKYAEARMVLLQLAIKRTEAHDTLVFICKHAKLSDAERNALCHERTATHLLELTAGQPDDEHNAICLRMIEKARKALRDEASWSEC